jgi:hypothetical protein
MPQIDERDALEMKKWFVPLNDEEKKKTIRQKVADKVVASGNPGLVKKDM